MLQVSQRAHRAPQFHLFCRLYQLWNMGSQHQIVPTAHGPSLGATALTQPHTVIGFAYLLVLTSDATCPAGKAGQYRSCTSS